MLEALQWLESTSLGAIARESLYGFQILVAIHILGLIFSVGPLLWVDLRMLGIGLTGQALPTLYRALSKWFVVGFGVMFLSGLALFAGFATSAYENMFFRIKIVVIVLAGANAVAFHTLMRQSPEAPSAVGPPLRLVRLAGLVSIVCWAVVILLGRSISYTLF